ncbi:integrase, catalytic region, zinc finger, CCHC-type containing protein [Tanacetum coccineum]
MSKFKYPFATSIINAFHNAIMEAGSTIVPPNVSTRKYMENKKNVFTRERRSLNAEAEANKLIERMILMKSPDDQDLMRIATGKHPEQRDTEDLRSERDLLASLIQKLKCEIDDNKNQNKFLESSNKALVDKLKGEIEDFKTKNKSLESSNNHFKEANNELSKTNQLMFKDLKKFQAELDKYNDVNYASKVEIDCAKAKGDLMSYKINLKKTISIMSQAKEAQIKLYKTREDKELDKVIALENKVKVLNDIVYKTGQSVQTMNMLNRNCKTSFAKPEFLKKAQRANPRLYDIGCYNDNLALMLAPESDETIRLDKERRSKLSDLIRPFDYDKLNNLYDLFVPQREKSPEQHYFPKTSKMSHTSSNNEFSKESFRKQTTLLEKRMDESIPWDQNWWNPKYTPPDIIGNQVLQKEMFIQTLVWPLGNASLELANILEHMTPSVPTVSNTPICLQIYAARTVKFGNDQIAPILGYGDLVHGAQYLYSITLQDSTTPNPICLMAKATSSQSWLWHRRLSHLNFDTINLLSKNNIMNGSKIKIVKDHTVFFM